MFAFTFHLIDLDTEVEHSAVAYARSAQAAWLTVRSQHSRPVLLSWAEGIDADLIEQA